MNICIPVESDAGLQSSVNAHFGSAPVFLIVDTDTGDTRAVGNRNRVHSHGMCQPLAALAGQAVDAVVVGGIGVGALNKFRAANIQVYLSQYRTVQETVDAYKAGSLQPVTPQTACAQHGQGQQEGGQGRGQGGCGQQVQRRGKGRNPGGRNQP